MRSFAFVYANVALALLFSALAGCSSQKSPSETQSAEATSVPRQAEAKFAYAAGLGIGRRLRDMMREDGLSADHDLILRGVRDGLESRPTPYPEDEMEQAVSRIEAAVRQRRAEKQYAEDPNFRKMADENLQNSRDALARAASMYGVQTLPSGLLVQVLKPGDGRFVAAAPTIKANYTLSLADKTVVRSSDPGVPAIVHLSRLPSALAEVIQEMRVGSKCRIALPPEQAYGLGGLPPVIGPNQGLLLEFEIIGID